MAVTTTVSSEKPSVVAADVIVIPVAASRALDGLLSSAVRQKIAQHMRRFGFAGAAGNAELFMWRGAGLQASFVGLVDLGAQGGTAERYAEAMRRGVARIVQDARNHGVRHIAVDLLALPEFLRVDEAMRADVVAALGAATVEGVELAHYRYTEYSRRLQHEQRSRAMHRLTLLVDKQYARGVRSSVTRARHVLQGVLLARDLVNKPAGAMRPQTLVEHARSLAKTSPLISVTVWDRKQAQQQGFTAFLAVARGSAEEPFVIHLTYRPSMPAVQKIFVVGKGITFDSGGLNLKPTGYLESMKMDMAGAASVLGLFSVLPQLDLPVEVHGVIATCENMPSGTAYRPGDVLHAKNGKTIEVLNTDAEGRITLADALSFAVEQKPDAVIDLATLTGACMVALGETHAGLWSNSEALASALLAAAQKAGEGLTQLPMPEEYRLYLESKVADVRNVRGPTEKVGGAIEGALFLREFVGDVPWAHLDIAGPAYMEKPILPYYPLGATGYGVRTLVEFLRRVGVRQSNP